MKKLLLCALPLTLAAGVANSQTKKVMLEDYTGLNCGWCPEGTVIIENMMVAHPTNFIPIAIHTGSYEPTSSVLNAGTVGSTLTSSTGVTGYPNGSVDRKKYTGTSISMGRGSWTNAYNTQAAKTAIVSVSLAKMVESPKGSNNFEADINVKFTAAPTAGVPIVVQAYIIEDSIAATGALAQHNYSSSVQSGASILNPWYHNRTFRKALSGDAWGFTGVVPANPVVGTTYTKHITFSKDASWVKKNVKVIAYVAYNGAAASDQKEILNAEEMKLSSFYPLGVSNFNEGVNIIGAYPNPASQNEVVKVEYNLNESSNVTLNVYNAVGQLVAKPYSSYEVEGGHTFQWRAADHNLPAGVYILQLSSDKGGKQTMKVNIY